MRAGRAIGARPISITHDRDMRMSSLKCGAVHVVDDVTEVEEVLPALAISGWVGSV